jgi:hypothetical protein
VAPRGRSLDHFLMPIIAMPITVNGTDGVHHVFTETGETTQSSVS